jgi:hypothetical protein
VTIIDRVQLLDEALAADPTNPVITEADAELLGSSKRAALLARGAVSSSSVLVAYTAARATYTAGDDEACIGDMRLVLVLTTNADIRSSALTYIALSELGLGDQTAYRTDLLAAVAADVGDHNQLAREDAAGLYQPQTP